MVYKVYSGRVGGVLGDLITVEVDASPGLPVLDMIGLLGSEVREARERVRVALKNNGISLPAMRITVNLSPADEHKNGSLYDLPIAVALLGVLGKLGSFDPGKTLVIGELALDGKIMPVRGVLPIVRMARERGFQRVVLPLKNAEEGAMIRGIDIIPVETLGEAMAYLCLPEEYLDSQIPPFQGQDFYETEKENIPDFNEVVGQEVAKRAAVIAAAGFHHLLMTGPPGTGKSLIAKRIPGIMPKLSYEESLEVTTIYSVAGKLTQDRPFIKDRPFLSPHHGASAQALAGGGPNAAPGLISLAHRGILFLDELPEFKKQTLDYLRQPMEDGKITVSRSRGSLVYPSAFMLVGAMNPCPCGFYPDRNRCNCSEIMVNRYLSRISGPILDRIDLCVEVSRMEPEELEAGRKVQGMGSAEMREMVLRAVKAQEDRYQKETFRFNSQLPSAKTGEYIPMSKETLKFAHELYTRLNLSMRAYYKIIRVARTIADVDGEELVERKHLAEASCYRFPDYMGG